MVAVQQFEDLKIWQEARELVAQIYFSFGSESRAGQDYGFRNQMTRASLSVMNNIAEGFERSTVRDFAHFLTIAKASAGDCNDCDQAKSAPAVADRAVEASVVVASQE